MKRHLAILLAVMMVFIAIPAFAGGGGDDSSWDGHGDFDGHRNHPTHVTNKNNNRNNNVNKPSAKAYGGNAEGGNAISKNTNKNNNTNKAYGGEADANAVGVGVGIGKGGAGGDGGNAKAVARGGKGGNAEQSQDQLQGQLQGQQQGQEQATDVHVRNKNRQNTDVNTNVNTGVNTTVGNKGVVSSNNDNRSSAEQQSVVETNVEVEGDSYSSNYTDESIYASIATQPGKTEVQVGVPGLAAITLSDDTRVSTLNLTLHTTLELYKAGLISKEEAQVIVVEELEHLRKAANGPRGRTLFNLFGLLR